MPRVCGGLTKEWGMRRLFTTVVMAGAFLVFTIPGTALATCPETELARILCPGGGGRIYVCQDHHGIITVHHHCPR
jgi:hypothetical protein